MRARIQQQINEPAILVRVEHAAGLMNIGRTSTYDLIGRGELQAVKVGRSLRVVRSSIDAWIARQIEAQGVA